MNDVKKILKEFDNLPRFKDGRINYTNSRRAPCLAVFINFDEKILLLGDYSKNGPKKLIIKLNYDDRYEKSVVRQVFLGQKVCLLR